MCSGRVGLFTSLIVFSTILILLIPFGSSRADFEPGRQAYLRGDYAEALALFLPSALEGNAKSQIGLGLLLARGQGAATDLVRSYTWFDLAAAQAENEHVVVWILARTNRDYLGKQMTAEQVAKAKLWSTMIIARSELLNAPPLADLHRVPIIKKRRMSKRTDVPSTDRSKLDAKRAASYRIQLAALRKGQSTELLAIWRKLSKRHVSLNKLQPVLVRMDLGGSGVYDGLRAGPFNDSRSASRVCDRLIADKQDCIVVAR